MYIYSHGSKFYLKQWMVSSFIRKNFICNIYKKETKLTFSANLKPVSSDIHFLATENKVFITPIWVGLPLWTISKGIWQPPHHVYNPANPLLYVHGFKLKNIMGFWVFRNNSNFPSNDFRMSKRIVKSRGFRMSINLFRSNMNTW